MSARGQGMASAFSPLAIREKPRPAAIFIEDAPDHGGFLGHDLALEVIRGAHVA